jgi:galactoside O-acetyltransferase
MNIIDNYDSQVEVGENSHLMCQVYFYKKGQLKVGALSYIGPETGLHITDSIVIGENVLIASSCTLIDSDMHSLIFDERKDDILLDINNNLNKKKWDDIKCAPIIIEDKAWIGLGSIILKGVTIGEGSIVGAGSVVTKNVPPWVIVAGNPARIVKKLKKSN